jgi:hypothetical protein
MNGNDSDFEQFLKRRRVPALPEEWRGEILRRAESEGRRAEVNERARPWWSAWLWPSPWAWAGIGCAWALALGMNAMSGAQEGGAPAAAAPRTEAVYTRIIEERRLVREFFGAPESPAAQPPPAPVPSGAWYERRKQGQTMAA